jgi:hypothetical protein
MKQYASQMGSEEEDSDQEIERKVNAAYQKKTTFAQEDLR